MNPEAILHASNVIAEPTKVPRVASSQRGVVFRTFLGKLTSILLAGWGRIRIGLSKPIGPTAAGDTYFPPSSNIDLVEAFWSPFLTRFTLYSLVFPPQRNQ